MANRPNGAGDGASFMMPPAPGDGIFGMPPAPGQAPVLDTRRALPAPPVEHQTPSPGPPPATVDYEGGGIFSASTPGPAEDGLPQEQSAIESRGSDFGPNMAMTAVGPQMQAPMMQAPMTQAPMMQAPPMAAPYMPDVGPPPTQGGVLGSLQEDKGNLGMTMIAAAGGAGVGLYYGGVWGAIAGSLFGGAAVSVYRALKHVKDGTPESDKEAVTSGTYAVGAAAAGGIIWAKLVQPGAGYARNKPRRKKQHEDVLENPDACSIRPVGP